MIIQNCQMTQDFIGNLEFQLNFESIQQNSIVPDGSPTFAHHKQFNHVNQNVSIYSNIGNRSENLDQFDYYQTSNYQLFAIYDGHGDSTVSKHLKNNLLKTLINHPLFHCDFTSAAFQTFHFIENEILMRQNLLELNSGSVAIIVLIRDNCVYTVNLGDCRALLVDEFANYKILNRQHNLDNFQQYETIKQKGGIILRRGKSFRLNGQINISRSFGDKKHKEYMSSVPEISITPIRGQKYIVMGSDGFWNEASNKKVAQSLLKSPKIKNKAEHLYNLGPKAKDNSTIICISLTN